MLIYFPAHIRPAPLHESRNAFLRIGGLHQFVEINLLRTRQSFVKMDGVPRIESLLCYR